MRRGQSAMMPSTAPSSAPARGGRVTRNQLAQAPELFLSHSPTPDASTRAFGRTASGDSRRAYSQAARLHYNAENAREAGRAAE